MLLQHSVRALRQASKSTLTSRAAPVVTCKMSNAAGDGKKRHEWIVILPDHAGALEKRMQVRPYAFLYFFNAPLFM